MTQCNRPSTDSSNPEKQILELLAVLRRPGEITEVRGLIKSPDGRRTETRAGYFSDPDHHSLAAASLHFDRECTPYGVFFVLNPVKEVPTGGHANGRIVRTNKAAKDKDVSTARYLLLDIDPVRAESGGMATDSEKAAAFALAQHIERTLAEEFNWHATADKDSGNGFQMIMPVPDGLSVHMRKLLLIALASRFDTASAKIDRKTYNPARLGRVPGTWNRKGENLPERPHRQAQLLSINSAATAITTEHLEALVGVDTGPSSLEGAGPQDPSTAPPTELTPQLAERIRRYLAKVPGAVSGNHGQPLTFALAIALVQDFGLAPADAYELLVEWNPRCTPPWTEAEMKRKLADAVKKVPRDGRPRGWMAADRDLGSDGDEHDGTGDAGERKPSAVEIMVGLIPEDALFRDQNGVAHVTRGGLCVAVESRDFEDELFERYLGMTGRIPGPEQVKSATTALASMARRKGPERTVHLRYAVHMMSVYVALYDAAETIIEIDARGWRPCANPPVLFRKSSLNKAMPLPTWGGSLRELLKFLNLADDDALALLFGFLTAAVYAVGSAAILLLMGAHRSGKSTTTKVLQRLLDPSAVEAANPPDTVKELWILTQHMAALAYDNVSFLSNEMSDAYCRLATGSTLTMRELYTTAEVAAFRARRTVVLNGIADFASRADFLDRCLVLRHTAIPDNAQKSDSELEVAFEDALPRLLGALFDRVYGGLKELPNIGQVTGGRLMDFAAFAVACERAAGEQPRFQHAYMRNQADARADLAADSPVLAAVVKALQYQSQLSGPVSELYALLTPAKPPTDWPKSASAFGKTLDRFAPVLESACGVKCVRDRTSRARTVTLTRIAGAVADPAVPSSLPSPGLGHFPGPVTAVTAVTAVSPPSPGIDPDIRLSVATGDAQPA